MALFCSYPIKIDNRTLCDYTKIEVQLRANEYKINKKQRKDAHRMKKIRKSISFLLVLTLLFTNCGLGNMQVEAAKKENKKPTKITLSDSKKNLAVGETFTLKVKSVKPSNASKSVTWSTSSKKIATVSKKGKVTAKKTGSVTISAKSTINKKVVAKCKIKVYKATKTLKLNSEKSYELTVGQTQTLSAKVTNPKKGAAPVEWSSSDEKVAKVSSKGKVTAIAEGKATITAKSGKKKVKVSITVKAKDAGSDTGNTPGTQNPGTGDAKNPGTGGTQKPGTNPGSGTNPGNAPSGDNPSGGTEPSDPPVDDSILHYGTWNGIKWSINNEQKLVIEGTDTRTGDYDAAPELYDALPPWNEYIQELKTAVVKAKNVKSTYGWFCEGYNLTNIDMTEFDTSEVVTMYEMFSWCGDLHNLDVSKFNTQNVTDMRGMFQNCSSLTCLDVTNFNTGKVTDMGYMFSCCNSLTSVDTSGFDTSQVTDMEFMFQSCDNLQQ